jgi:hypothetical protein
MGEGHAGPPMELRDEIRELVLNKAALVDAPEVDARVTEDEPQSNQQASVADDQSEVETPAPYKDIDDTVHEEVIPMSSQELVRVSQDLLPFMRRSHLITDVESHELFADPEVVDKAEQDRAQLEQEKLDSVARLLEDSAETDKTIEVISAELAEELLTDTRQSDLLNEPNNYIHALAHMLTSAYQARIIPQLEARFGLDYQAIKNILSDEVLQNAAERARMLYENRMVASGHSPDAFGLKNAYDLRLDPHVIRLYTSKLIAHAIYENFAASSSTSSEAHTPQFSIRSLKSFIKKSTFETVESKIEKIKLVEMSELAQRKIRLQDALDTVQLELNEIAEMVSAPAMGDPGNLERVYVFGGENGRHESTKNTLIIFGGTDVDVKKVSGGTTGKTERYEIIGSVGGFDPDSQEPDLRSRILSASDRYRSHIPQKGAISPGPSSNEPVIHNKIGIVGLLPSGPHGTTMEPAVYEMWYSGDDGELGAPMGTRYEVIIERVTQQVYMELQRAWAELEALHGLVPVGEEINNIEIWKANMIQGAVPAALSQQKSEFELWRKNRDSNPPVIELHRPPAVAVGSGKG